MVGWEKLRLQSPSTGHARCPEEPVANILQRFALRLTSLTSKEEPSTALSPRSPYIDHELGTGAGSRGPLLRVGISSISDPLSGRSGAEGYMMQRLRTR